VDKQIYWDDVSQGAEIPELVKHPSFATYMEYLGACGNTTPFHNNLPFAQQQGAPDIVAPGLMMNAYLGQLVANWIGTEGWIKKIGCQYRGMNFPDKQSMLRAVVTRKYQENGEYLLDLDLSSENEEGFNTTPGYATVSLPSRQPKI